MTSEMGVNNSGAESKNSYNSYLQSPEDAQTMEAMYGKPPAPEPVVAVAPPPVQVSETDRNFAAMRDEMSRQRRENEELRYNLELWKSQLTKQNQPVPEIESIDRSEPLTRGAYEEDMTGKFRQMQQQIADLQFKVTENTVASKYSDYDEVVEKYTVPLVKEKPHLADGIRSAENKPLFAYELGKMQRELEQSRQELQRAKSQYSYQQAPTASQPVSSPQLRMLENAMKPGSLSMTGGQGTFVPQTVNYATMSDAEFDAFYKANTRDH
jgi:hypothetical protein